MLRWKYSAVGLISFLAFGSAYLSRAQSNTAEVSSPDHQITLRFSVQPGKGQETGQDGQLVYFVTFHDKQVFENSALRLELANQPPLGAAVHIAGSTPGSGVDDYTLLAGKASAIHDGYNSLTLHAVESASPGRRFDIE
ncbi:MAG: glycoside hydrolase family 97 N-terminal domain-containing protein, partial [Candidatus Sulfotelmatobacter sp.]